MLYDFEQHLLTKMDLIMYELLDLGCKIVISFSRQKNEKFVEIHSKVVFRLTINFYKTNCCPNNILLIVY